MEFLQLTYFCHAAETENFAKTAREFGVPATGVSQSVKRLESELGTLLFDRSSNGIKLNAQGASFYVSAKSALSTLDDAKKKLRDEEVSGECRLLVMTCRSLVSDAIRAFREKYKNVSFFISYDIAEDVDKYDLIVTDNVPFRQNYRVTRLLTDTILLAVSKSHPLAARERVHVSELADERFIVTNKGSGLFTITGSICAKGYFTPKVALEVDDPRSVLSAIGAGIGVGFVPSVSWQDMMTPDIALLSVDGTKTGNTIRPSFVLQSTEKYASKTSRLFLEELQKTAEAYRQ